MMRRAQPWLGTMVEIGVEGTPDQDAVNAAFAAVARVHQLMSFHDPASEVARFNRAAAGELVTVERDTWDVLRIALEVSALSDGVFDIGCAPHLVEWGVLPALEQGVPAALPCTGMLALEREGCVRKLAPGWIDLGGIAKGYAVDLAVQVLREALVPGGCVNAGGDLRVFGQAQRPVAVRAPHAPGVAATVTMLHDAALATSGSYFSARSHAGRTVSALVDTRAGTPLVTRHSASVRAPTCVLADALTKVVLLTGNAHHPALAARGATAFFV